MLKIVRSANPDFVLFTLSGHIDAEHAAELQGAFDGEALPTVLDLREVKRVDREVVVHGNLVTSRQPSDVPAVTREMLSLSAAARGA